MIWLVLAALAIAAMAPLAWSMRAQAAVRSRRTAAIDLHRAQLSELDRDLDQGRIATPEHATARLEVQRRLLAEADTADAGTTASRAPLVVALIVTPIAALLLYLPGAAPNMPAIPLAARIAQSRRAAQDAEGLVGQLQAKIATLPPGSDAAREGYVLLGNLQDTRDNLPAAADAWGRAIAIRFDPTLAAQVAEAHSRIDGSVSPQSAELFRRALAAAPADAPWRAVAQQRLASLSAPQATPPASPATPGPVAPAAPVPAATPPR